MMALVDYGSSGDEDDGHEEVTQEPGTNDPVESAKPAFVHNGTHLEVQVNGKAPEPQPNPAALEAPLSNAPLVGPVIGPTIPTDMPTVDALQGEEEDGHDTVHSPYSANRALLRDLTLPTVANYDIPPSPPGSPIASTNAKFKHFLELKKQGIHFNDKLGKSSVLRNPSLMQKLMDFADIDEAGQYATTLPKELWNSDGFPEHAFKEELAKSQQRILKQKEEEKVRGQREAVDFVPASASGDSSRSGTPGAARTGQKSTAERIMAGLDRGRSNSPQVAGVKRKTRFES